MGAAPRTSPTPAQVAHSFVSVYYRVAAKLPKRLGEFYGGSSELDHGEGFCAHGSAIAALGDRLPLAGCAVTVRRLSVQATGNGAFVVVVIGSFVKAGETVAFTQTFILEKQVDSHDEHFFCRNDIFSPITEDDDNVVISVSENDKAQAEASAAQPQAAVAQSASTEPVSKVPAPSPVTPVKQSLEAESVPPEVLEPAVDSPDTTSIEEVVQMPLPDNVVNGSAAPHEEQTPISHPEQVAARDVPIATADSEAASETTATHPDETPLAETSLPNGGDNTETEVPKPAPAPPVKKTWASIVSSRDDVGNIPSSHPAPAEEPVVPKPTKEQLENVPPTVDSDTKSTAQTGGSRPSGPPNGHRPAHHVSRGSQRSFGPSAVVQLSALSQTQLQDTRGLVNSLRDEFGNYGYKLRNVDVKASKGIAFVEYETLDGVKAAVAQWASGPKNDGPFAGIALLVSEKRPSHGGRRPGSVRGGGRGGPRGGRRPRPNSTPLS